MIEKIFHLFIWLIKKVINHCEVKYFRSKLGHCDKTAVISSPFSCPCPSKVFIYENTNLLGNSKFIISPVGEGGRFIMKRNSGAAQGLTVITHNHGRSVGINFKDENGMIQPSLNKNADVVIEEDVWIGTDVTLCAGVTIGRCSNVGAGSVIRHDVPPYSIVIGNPAKVVGFCFTPDEIIEHEKEVFPEGMRLPIGMLEKNYNKYFLKRINEIKQFSRL